MAVPGFECEPGSKLMILKREGLMLPVGERSLRGCDCQLIQELDPAMGGSSLSPLAFECALYLASPLSEVAPRL